MGGEKLFSVGTFPKARGFDSPKITGGFPQTISAGFIVFPAPLFQRAQRNCCGEGTPPRGGGLEIKRVKKKVLPPLLKRSTGFNQRDPKKLKDHRGN